MSDSRVMGRRDLMQVAAGAALAQIIAAGLPATAEAMPAATMRPVPPGKPGEFDFLDGKWSVKHRMLNATGDKWLDFTGTARCWTILGGVGSVEELSVPSRDFQGMGLRLLDVKAKVWSDFWVNAKSGALTTPGTTGGFENGVGTFLADETDDGKPIKIRGVWDEITRSSCRWRQGLSRDAGKTWKDNWVMHWTRV